MFELRPTRWPLVMAAIMYLVVEFRIFDHIARTERYVQKGLDFFSIPRSFISYLHGRSVYEVFDTGFSYGPYSQYFVFHPAVSFVFGSWLHLFSPWVSYRIFLIGSLLMLAHLSLLMKDCFQKSKYASFAGAYVVFFSIMTYSMLLKGQIHVLCVLGCGYVLWVLQKSVGTSPTPALKRFFIFGVLLSLFSKPLIAVAFPALLLNRIWRRPTLKAIGFYLLISAVLVLVSSSHSSDSIKQLMDFPNSFVGDKDKNWKKYDIFWHWAWMVQETSYIGNSLKTGLRYFSLPALLRVYVFPWMQNSVLFQLFYVPPLLLSFRSEKNRDEILLLVIFAMSSYFLCITAVWEYHYISLQIMIPFLFWLSNRTRDAFEKRCLLVASAFGLLLFLPSTYFFRPYWSSFSDIAGNLFRLSSGFCK